MATRQKDKNKDIVNFSKKLRKRYPIDADMQTRERKILERVVFAIFLENAPYETACSCYNKLERYFIDWNEARVSKANEIAVVVGSVPNALKSGDRLRRLLQWIFDKTFKFDLEDVRVKGVEETLGFLETVPFSTRFMNEFVCLFGFGFPVLPLDEGALRVFRLLGWVEVRDDKEVVPALDGVFKEAELKEFFFAVHKLGCELMDESTQDGAIKFLATIDSDATKRSYEPLVESKIPTDPSEIAKLYAKRERPSKPLSTSAMMSEMYGDGAMDTDEMDGSDDFEKEGDDGEYDPYNAENTDEFASDGLGGRRGVQEPAYSVGKRAETTLSKDGASYSESVSDSSDSNDYEAARSVRSERVAKTRKRVKEVESETEASRKSVKSVSSRSTKGAARQNSEENDVPEGNMVVGASDEKEPVEKKSDEKKPSEKKAVEKKAVEKKSSEKRSNEKKSSASESGVSEKSRSQAVDADDAKNVEVKKATRVSKSKKVSDNSESVADSTTVVSEKKKSVSSVQNVSEKKSVDEGVKKEKKTSSKSSKESASKSKDTSGVLNVESNKKRVKEQEVVDDGAAKTKRRRESEAPKIDPPLSRSKKR